MTENIDMASGQTCVPGGAHQIGGDEISPLTPLERELLALLKEARDYIASTEYDSLVARMDARIDAALKRAGV